MGSTHAHPSGEDHDDDDDYQKYDYFPPLFQYFMKRPEREELLRDINRRWNADHEDFAETSCGRKFKVSFKDQEELVAVRSFKREDYDGNRTGFANRYGYGNFVGGRDQLVGLGLPKTNFLDSYRSFQLSSPCFIRSPRNGVLRYPDPVKEELFEDEMMNDNRSPKDTKQNDSPPIESKKAGAGGDHSSGESTELLNPNKDTVGATADADVTPKYKDYFKKLPPAEKCKKRLTYGGQESIKMEAEIKRQQTKEQCEKVSSSSENGGGVAYTKFPLKPQLKSRSGAGFEADKFRLHIVFTKKSLDFLNDLEKTPALVSDIKLKIEKENIDKQVLRNVFSDKIIKLLLDEGECSKGASKPNLMTRPVSVDGFGAQRGNKGVSSMVHKSEVRQLRDKAEEQISKEEVVSSTVEKDGSAKKSSKARSSSESAKRTNKYRSMKDSSSDFEGSPRGRSPRGMNSGGSPKGILKSCQTSPVVGDGKSCQTLSPRNDETISQLSQVQKSFQRSSLGAPRCPQTAPQQAAGNLSPKSSRNENDKFLRGYVGSNVLKRNSAQSTSTKKEAHIGSGDRVGQKLGSICKTFDPDILSRKDLGLNEWLGQKRNMERRKREVETTKTMSQFYDMKVGENQYPPNWGMRLGFNGWSTFGSSKDRK